MTTADESPSTTATFPFTLARSGVIMAPDPAEPFEAEGVLNPATAWNSAGDLLLYPRLVGHGNFSRIGRAYVTLEDGVPSGVQRDGVALEPARSWEHGSNHGGTEDPRITWVPSLGVHVMTYVAFGPTGPRPALAVSTDATTWRRLGPLLFSYEDELDVDLTLYPNKDVVLFPDVVPAPDGVPSYAMLHRPMWDLSFTRPLDEVQLPQWIGDPRPSIWISYIPAADVLADLSALTRPGKHAPVAHPEQPWEELKIGAGPAPLRVDEGWLLLYHGVSGTITDGPFAPQDNVSYAAGAMILDADDPSRVIARSAEPLLAPETADETTGTVANVVFPTAIERIGERDWVFYGMADSRIGIAELSREVAR